MNRCVGDLAITAIPFKVFLETELTIRDESLFPTTFTISHAGGGFGYLPTPEHHERGGYETWLGTNIVEVGASTKIEKRLLMMLGD